MKNVRMRACREIKLMARASKCEGWWHEDKTATRAPEKGEWSGITAPRRACSETRAKATCPTLGLGETVRQSHHGPNEAQSGSAETRL